MSKLFLQMHQQWLANMYSWCQKKAAANQGHRDHYEERAQHYKNRFFEITKQLETCQAK